MASPNFEDLEFNILQKNNSVVDKDSDPNINFFNDFDFENSTSKYYSSENFNSIPNSNNPSIFP